MGRTLLKSGGKRGAQTSVIELNGKPQGQHHSRVGNVAARGEALVTFLLDQDKTENSFRAKTLATLRPVPTGKPPGRGHPMRAAHRTIPLISASTSLT
jgi:hypothetical protein